MNPTPRQRLVSATVSLVGARGGDAVSIGDILEVSRSHRNSLYRHFPAGKSQLLVAATTEVGAEIGRLLSAEAQSDEATTPSEYVSAFIDMWRRMLVASDYSVGCPVFAGAFSSDRAVTEAASHCLESWQTALVEALGQQGQAADTSRTDLASVAISAVEGAIGRCRLERSTAPLDVVERHLLGVLHANDV